MGRITRLAFAMLDSYQQICLDFKVMCECLEITQYIPNFFDVNINNNNFA